ncbi:reverse transcriptase (RNA-dependent DNA polymerase) domain-containing protein [Ditylenchus destructor]|uniref:Reverse transcriptase (RNA-dependent DNA polymerase) domain-containing protein n=1 Tax=Ditylenchus destructor TaxID=166010 RepID=A0AAD4MK37_9BILA|nr:reverse transcriptase (RNA-dependent DNA polymerase) domain-containing protein [Ditylenchus destructor]
MATISLPSEVLLEVLKFVPYENAMDLVQTSKSWAKLLQDQLKERQEAMKTEIGRLEDDLGEKYREYKSTFQRLVDDENRISDDFKTNVARASGISQQKSAIALFNHHLQAIQNRKPRSDTLFCADFSNLFTSLPHEDIIDAIMYLTTRTFEAQNGKKEIHCNQYRAFFSHQYHKNYTPYTLYEVKYMVEFLIKNSYVRFADRNFVQIKGVPQGGNASPLLSDLMLTAMEIKYLGTCDNLVKRELSVSFRYIDDLFSLNENIKNHTAAIYGNVLELNRTDNRNGTAFLDLDIKLCNEKIEIKTYDKTRDFRFEPWKALDKPKTRPLWIRLRAPQYTQRETTDGEVDGAEVNDTTLNANRRACFNDKNVNANAMIRYRANARRRQPDIINKIERLESILDQSRKPEAEPSPDLERRRDRYGIAKTVTVLLGLIVLLTFLANITGWEKKFPQYSVILAIVSGIGLAVLLPLSVVGFY